MRDDEKHQRNQQMFFKRILLYFKQRTKHQEKQEKKHIRQPEITGDKQELGINISGFLW